MKKCFFKNIYIHKSNLNNSFFINNIYFLFKYNNLTTLSFTHTLEG